MSGVNKVILLGNLGQNPELRVTGSGTSVCDLSIATSRKYKDSSGQMQEQTEWHRVTCWGKQAELAKEYLAKGKQVYVEGRLETQKYVDKKDGSTKYSTKIICEQLVFVGNGGGKSSTSNDEPPMNQDDDLPF